MIRNLLMGAALVAASVGGVPASARTSITFSLGTGVYGYDGYGNDYDPYDRGGYYEQYGQPSVWGPGYYADPLAGSYYAYDRSYAWRAHQRREQIERWRREQDRRRYWDHERREHHRWHDDDDDGD